jgi:hypothetical protein
VNKLIDKIKSFCENNNVYGQHLEIFKRKDECIMENTVSSPRRKRLGCGGIALILLGIAALFLAYGFIPASAATISLKPAIYDYKNQYNIIFRQRYSTRALGKGAVEMKSLGQALSQSKTVPATGRGSTPLKATGRLTLSQITLTNGRSSSLLDASIITSSSGIKILTSEVRVTVGGTTSVSASAVEAGSAGNIPAYDINGTYEIVDKLTQIRTGTAYIVNSAPFSGGRDAGTYTSVQQKDLDDAAKSIETKLISDTKAQLQKSFTPTTRIVPGKEMVCQTKTSSDPKVGAAGTNVKVTVTTTCTVSIYDEQELFDVTAKLQEVEVKKQHGSGYTPYGKPALKFVKQDGNYTSIVAMTIERAGKWIYTVNPQQYAKEIAGQPMWWIQTGLRTSDDFTSHSVSSPIFGGAFPRSPDQIKVQLLS